MRKLKKKAIQDAAVSLEDMLAELKPFLPKRDAVEPARPTEWRLAPGSYGVRIEHQNKSNAK